MLTVLRNTILVLALTVSYSILGQDWVDGMMDPSVNFYQVQQDFNKYWENREVEKGKGFKQFKRWEYFMEQRVAPTGERPNPSILYNTIQQINTNTYVPNLGEWLPVGPTNGNALGGVGRINCVAFDPDHPDTVYVGAPAGGFWTSYDGGVNWFTTTDDLTNIGVSSIAVDQNNPQVIYIGTGDRDAGDTYSFGVMKSTDGGKTWNSTGLSHNVANNYRIGQVWVDPSNSQTVIAATSVGIYKSTNGGQSFSLKQGGNFRSMVSNPLNPNTLFGMTYGTNSTRLFKSVDNGDSWTQITSGLPSNGVRRGEIGVTPHDTSYVYILYGNTSNGFYGLYRSTDGGNNFTSRATSPNLLGWSTTGNDTGGQAWYDLCIAVSPLNKNEIYTGGINVWKSSNGGATWSLNGHWYGGGGAPYIHADQHYMAWQPKTNALYVGNDGGIYKTTNGGSSYSSLNDGINITQYYKIGVSSNKIIAGAQDNGTHLQDNTWDRVRGGDGMDCDIDPNNENIMYSSVYYGNIRKSTNGGQSFNAAFNLSPSGTGNWVTPFEIDPSNSNRLLAGFGKLWISTNAGLSFSSVGPTFSSNIDEIAVAPSNGSIIYVVVNSTLYRTTNGGASFSTISGGISNNNDITDVAINPLDPNDIFITKSGYSNGNKVFRSTNGGTSWTNISGNLPNLPANAIEYQSGTTGGVYVGTDVGIYYRDDLTQSWTRYSKDLPNVIVTDLEIRYDSRTLVAGTYGRGTYISPLITELRDIPQVDFIADKYSTCTTTDTITLEDQSLKFPNKWKWSFYPSTPTFVNGTTDSSKTIQVVFSQTGTYSVKLEASNRYGKGEEVKVHMINVGGYPAIFSEDFEGNWSDNWTFDNPDGNITWEVGSAGLNNSAAQIDLYSYNAVGQKDGLISPVLSLKNVSNPILTFDRSYRQYAATNNDSLIVLVSTNCGTSYTRIAAFGANDLKTGNPTTSAFTPSNAADWCASCDTINLSAFAGLSGLRLKFEVINDYGNNLYLDNILLSGDPTVKPQAGFLVNQQGCTADTVSFKDISSGIVSNYSWSFPGATPSTSSLRNPKVVYNTAGQYPVTLIVSNAQGADTISYTNYISITSSVTPTIQLSVSSTSICQGDAVSFIAQTTNGGSFGEIQWFINGQKVASNIDSLYTSGLSNGDVITAALLSSESCVTVDSVMSNAINMTVNAIPSVSLSAFANVCSYQTSVPLTGGSPSGGVYSGNFVTNGVFSPVNAGPGFHTIWYKYTNASGCSDSISRDIRVESDPIVFLTLQDLCVDAPARKISGGFPFGGVYTVNGNPATNIDPAALGVGKHAISYAVQSGLCIGTIIDTLEIFPLPQKPIIQNNGNILTTNVTGNVSYLWLDDNLDPLPQDSTNSFEIAYTGQYFVQVTNEYGCSILSDAFTATFVGLNEWGAKIGLQVYPNPSKGLVKIAVREASKQLQYEVTDLQGRLVKNGNLQAGVNNLDLSQLNSGVYLLKVSDGVNTSLLKVELIP